MLLSAAFLQQELPVRLAHRVTELENLPYGLSTKAPVLKVHPPTHPAFHSSATIMVTPARCVGTHVANYLSPYPFGPFEFLPQQDLNSHQVVGFCVSGRFVTGMWTRSKT